MVRVWPSFYGNVNWGWPQDKLYQLSFRDAEYAALIYMTTIVSAHGPAFYPHPDDAEDPEEVDPGVAAFREVIVMQDSVTVRDAVAEAEE